MDIVKTFSNDDKSYKLEVNYKDKSLMIALMSYFKTYYQNRTNLFAGKSDLDFNIDYCIETILHFQHYFELYLKELLENEHPLLPIKINSEKKSTILYYKLLKQMEILEEDYENLYCIEFTDALKITCDLIDTNLIDSKYSFINSGKNVLKALNTFRNRILHKGIYLLKYRALDDFICTHLLPIVKESIKVSNWNINLQAPDKIDNFDIIEELVKLGQQKTVDYGAIALIKEIGRALLNLPLSSECGQIQHHAILSVYEIPYFNPGYYGSRSYTACPICSNETFVYFIKDCIDDIYNYKYAKCLCCDFEVNEFIGKLEEAVLNGYILWKFDINVQ